MEKCGNCKFFIGGGDWSLCCSNPPEESKFNIFGFLCYADSDICENFKPNGEKCNESKETSANN